MSGSRCGANLELLSLCSPTLTRLQSGEKYKARKDALDPCLMNTPCRPVRAGFFKDSVPLPEVNSGLTETGEVT